MNTSTRRNLAALVLAAGTTLGAWSPACHSQPEQPKAGEFVIRGATSRPISVKFDGGTVAEYIKQVKASQGNAEGNRPLNVILGPGVERYSIRPLELQFVSVDTAVYALRYAVSADQGVLQISSAAAEDDSSPTFSIRATDRSGGAPQQELEVLSIAQLTNPTVDGVARPELAIKPDVILSAVELALPAGEEPARVKYHEESRLLILQGSKRATRAIQMVIEAMSDDQRRRLGDAGHTQKEMIEAKARVERAQVRVATAEQARSTMRDNFNRVTGLAKQGHASHEEVRDQQGAYAEAEASVLNAHSELNEAIALADLLDKRSTGYAGATPTDELASLRKVVEDQAAQIKALTEELNALRKQKNAK